MERFKKPTDKQLFDIAIMFNEGRVDPDKLSDMMAMCEFVIDRLYEHGDVLHPSSVEVQANDAALGNEK